MPERTFFFVSLYPIRIKLSSPPPPLRNLFHLSVRAIDFCGLLEPWKKISVNEEKYFDLSGRNCCSLFAFMYPTQPPFSKPQHQRVVLSMWLCAMYLFVFFFLFLSVLLRRHCRILDLVRTTRGRPAPLEVHRDRWAPSRPSLSRASTTSAKQVGKKLFRPEKPTATPSFPFLSLRPSSTSIISEWYLIPPHYLTPLLDEK